MKGDDMNSSRIWRGVVIAALGIGIAVAIAVGAYQAGFAHALATGSQGWVAPPGGPHAWGYGHGFFFAPFFFLFLALLMARALFWRRSWRGGCRHDRGVPPAFEEWHRRVHEQQTPPDSTTK
jgi:hypothetical protein